MFSSVSVLVRATLNFPNIEGSVMENKVGLKSSKKEIALRFTSMLVLNSSPSSLGRSWRRSILADGGEKVVDVIDSSCAL
jgi:hypothetical protein